MGLVLGNLHPLKVPCQNVCVSDLLADCVWGRKPAGFGRLDVLIHADSAYMVICSIKAHYQQTMWLVAMMSEWLSD